MLFVILYSISNEILDIMPAFEISKKLDIKTRMGWCPRTGGGQRLVIKGQQLMN